LDDEEKPRPSLPQSGLGKTAAWTGPLSRLRKSDILERGSPDSSYGLTRKVLDAPANRELFIRTREPASLAQQLAAAGSRRHESGAETAARGKRWVTSGPASGVGRNVDIQPLHA